MLQLCVLEHGWAVGRTDGQFVAVFRGSAVRWRAERYLRSLLC